MRGPHTIFMLLAMEGRAVAAAPQTPQLGGLRLPKGAPIALKDIKLHQFKNKILLCELR